ncbi:MAG: Holliday junction branch migration DNA helicase RuvB [Bacteroidetes bacterium QS_9_68_14]|nr:MAG: Holliday junction branch migration DNA helicase RuvB [Bacteroidetes bacterium QS_9_68_14]
MTAALQRGDALDHTLLFGPPGLGKCITPDSLVLTGQGLVPFRELIPNDLKPGTSCPLEAEVFGTEGLEKTSHVYASGRTSTRRVTTRSGFVLEGTPQHPVRVATPQGPQWRRLDQLEAGDPVAIGRGTELWADDVHRTFWTPDAPADRRHRMEARVGRLHAALADALDRPPAAVELRSAYCAMQEITASPTPEQTAHRLGLPLADGNAVATVAQPWDRVASGFTRLNDGRRSLTLDADLAYLLGVLVGDGNWERGANAPAFTITCDEAAMQEELRRVSREAFGKAPAVQTCGDRTAKLRFSQNQGKACLRLGSEAAGAWEKEIPSAVLTSPRAVVVGFLQGLFDADGHAREDGVELGTRSEALARQVQLVLANLGIVAYRSTKERAGTLFQVLYVGGRDALRFYEEVGFRLERKYARREALRQKERGWSRCGLVPGANGPLAALLDKTTPHSRAVHKTFSHVKRGDRVPSRQQIKKYLDLLPDRVRREPEYETIQALTDPHVLWDAVAEVEEDEAETFDFVVPGTHSFVANGFYNHNTTLAHITAEEMGAKIVTTSGPVLEKPASLSGVLTNLEEGDVLFIDEIHRLASVVEEYLYSAMEDYRIDILIDSGPSSRTVQVKLKPFTLVGATTRKGLLTAPLRARFGIDLRFDYYPAEVLQEIVERSAGILSIEITDDGAFEVARRSRGTPRVANRLLRRTRDFAEVEGEGVITEDIADHALGALDVDEEGLDDMDTRILLTLIENFGGGPTGLNNLSVSVGENAGTIEEVYEPYLIQEGFMERTPRGRIALRRAYHHFDLTPPEEEDLFG